MQEENISRAIIVVQMGMTPSAKQVRIMINQIENKLKLRYTVARNQKVLVLVEISL